MTSYLSDADEIPVRDAVRLGVRSQKFQLTGDVWVTLFEDGRVRVGSYNHDMVLLNLNNFSQGSGVHLRLVPKGEASDLED